MQIIKPVHNNEKFKVVRKFFSLKNKNIYFKGV